MSIQYYNTNANDFFEGTINVDMESIYARFTALLPIGGHILDAGCGSGRDTLVFKTLGYAVTAIDASAALAQLASTHVGQQVRVQKFEEITEVSVFDGVWACASLLHVPRDQLALNIRCLTKSLKPKGVLYASFKEGETSRTVHGRHFTDLTLERLDELMAVCGMKSLDSWRTEDQRPDRVGEFWVNVLGRKSSTVCSNS